MFKITLFFQAIILGIFIVLLEGCAVVPVAQSFRQQGASELYIAIHLQDFAKVKELVSSEADLEHIRSAKKGRQIYGATSGSVYGSDMYTSALSASVVSYITQIFKQKSKQIIQYLLDNGADADNPELIQTLKIHRYTLDLYGGEVLAMIEPFQDGIGIPGNSSKQKVLLAKQDSNELKEMRLELANIKQSIRQNNVITNPAVPTNTDYGESSNQPRTALVIGNSQYSYSPLKNPGNDAQDIASALKGLNFKVILKVDVAQREMEEAIEEFTNQLGKGGVGLFYYAGHGVQVSGANYLIPIGANINKQADVRYEAVNLGRVLDGMGEARNGLNIAILDACRDNPLPRSYRSNGKRGLVRVDSPEGTILAFSTSPGSVAQDGEGRNGLYTKYLLKHLKTKNISIENLLKRVSRDVKQMSGRKQNPWREFSFDGDFYF